MDIEDLTAESEYQKQANRQEMDVLRSDNRNEEVYIKQELIDDAIKGQTVLQEMEVLSSGDEPESETLGSESDASSMSDSSEESVDDNIDRDNESVYTKRKSDTNSESQQQKRLHVTNEADELWDNQSVLSNSGRNDNQGIQTNNQVSLKNVEENNFPGAQDRENAKESKQRVIQSDAKCKTVSSSSTTSYQNAGSDSEWEKIAFDRKNLFQKLQEQQSPGTRTSFKVPTKTVRHAKKVNFREPVRIVTEIKKQNPSNLKRRGIDFVEEKEKVSTPIKIEFNIGNTLTEFNIITEFSDLLDTFTHQDPSLRLRDKVAGNVIWEVGSTLPEKEQFIEQFTLREQTYRSGNTKVTIFCVVESNFTVNRLKYAEPTKTHIFQRNIWVKPDFYSTNVVSCPGFITLVHPKMTNKRMLEESLTEILRNTEICQEEDIVQAWERHHDNSGHSEGTAIPKFHIETTARKWGGLHTEVLSIHCSKEDATYLKYLLSEASSQEKIDKGVFVPTGIHLMEGKEVMYQLLQEHQEFINRVTSFQLGGIWYEDMYNKDGKESIQQLLMQAEGVRAIEQTHQTHYNGQWLVVIDKQHTNSLKEYITANIQKIYKNKAGKIPKLVTYQVDKGTQGYKLLLVDNNPGKVGTYAEALKHRFPQLIDRQQQDLQRSEKTAVTGIVNEQYTQVGLHKQSRDNSHQGGKVSVGSHGTERMDTTVEDRIKPPKRFLSHTEIGNHQQVRQNNDQDGQRNNAMQQTDITTVLQKKLEEFDKEWNSKIKEFEEINTQLMTKMNNTIEDRIDDMLDKKIKVISSTVSKSVTTKMVLAMRKIFPAQLFKTMEEGEEIIDMDTQEINGKEFTEQVKDIKNLEVHRTKGRSQQSSAAVVTALNDIELNNSLSTDPTHDNIKESGTPVR